MSQREPLSIAVIGMGRIGRLHARHLVNRLPRARLVAVSDIDPEGARSFAESLGLSEVHSDPRSILDDPGIKAVLICTPTDTHADLIQEAARAGKHIFCEKPIALDLASIDGALEAVRGAGVKLQIGFNRRFDANFRHIQRTVAEGGIGKPHLLRITSRDPGPPPLEYIKASGGIFLDMTIHDFDMARYLIGSEIEEVHAIGGVMVDSRFAEAGDIDTAVTTLKFAGGALGAIDNSRQAVYGYDQRVEVFGSEGSISAENNTPHRTTLAGRDAVRSPLPLNFFMDRYVDSYLAEIEEFIDCVNGGTEPPVTGLDGRAPVAIALAAQRSLEENRPVKVSEVE